jgi:hypothetical protein
MKSAASILLLVLIWAAVGCASSAKPEAMISVPAAPVHRSASDVVVTAIGGKETSAMLVSQISNADFALALRDSFDKAGLFKKALASGSAHYALDAFIVQVNQPMFGASMTVSMEVSYTLSRTEPKEVLWKKGISSTYTASFGEALVGATRLRMANEGAARKNIEQVIQEISSLKLD